MRDSQRGRLYSAEASAFQKQQLVDFATLREWIDEITASERWTALGGPAGIDVRQSRGTGGWYRHVDRRLMLPRMARRYYALHELAHAVHIARRVVASRLDLVPQEASHSPAFAAVYLDLVRWQLGEPAAAALAGAFCWWRVRVDGLPAPRPIERPAPAEWRMGG